MSQYIKPSIDIIKSLIENKNYLICSICKYDGVSILCSWKDKGFIISEEEFDYVDYFEDYFNVIEMLELNGIEIISPNYREAKSYSLQGKTLFLNNVSYCCNYQNIREKLKDVIDEILSKNKHTYE